MKFTFVFFDLVMEKLIIGAVFVSELPIYGLTWVLPSLLGWIPFPPPAPITHTHTLFSLEQLLSHTSMSGRL